MTLAYLLLLTGLTISAVAIYYSVVGLTAIFAAAAIPIMIMGVSLEVAKLVCATWIKQHWARVPMLMKTYMCTAITVLMLITSMGIFGFLSKAHMDQSLVSGDVLSRVSIYDEKIKTSKENIDANRRALKQMDEAVDQSMARSTSESGADKAVAIRRGQAKERARLQAEIATEQKAIATFNEQAAPIRAEIRKVDAEVGPIKYIAAFLYGVEPDASLLEKAVTWIIIMIVIVFDPLAVIMLLAAQMTFAWYSGAPVESTPRGPGIAERLRNRFKRKDKFEMQDLDATELDALNRALRDSYEPVEPVVTDELTADEIDRINRLAAEYAEPMEPDYTDYSEGALVPTEDPAPQEEPTAEEKKTQWAGFGFPLLSIFNPPKEEVKAEPAIVEQPKSNPMSMDERPGDYVEPEPVVDTPNPRAAEASPAAGRGVMVSAPVQADNAPALGHASNSGFGNTYPASPNKGDFYLRTDYLPNRLFKFNGKKWIEVDKEQTDLYAYDEMYIKHLIDQIAAGKYDADMLTDVERDQIQQYLTKNAQ